MKTGIVLSTRNNLLWLKECIKTLRWYTDLDNNELLVFDANCTDGTSEFLNEEGIRTIHSTVNIPGASAINILIEKTLQSKAIKYICMVHDDMIFTKDWLTTMLNDFEKTRDCYLLGCLSVVHKKAYLIPDDERNRIAGKLKEDFIGRAGPPIFLMSRECIERVGYFDENYGFGECSDNDYFKCIESIHKKFLLTHNAVIFHGEKIARMKVENVDEKIKKSKEYFLKKYPGTNLLNWGDKIIKYVMVENESFKVWGAK
jgi:GT2 family glycosyltransferase